jgi:hypothetical protein
MINDTMINDTDPTAGFDIFFLTCFPVNEGDQLEVGITHYKPVEGAVRMQCMRCGIPVWIGPRQAKLATDPRAQINCPKCLITFGAVLKDSGNELHFRSLGGQDSELKYDMSKVDHA